MILVDFFGGVPDSLQKPWHSLLLGRDLAEVSRRPEVEGHLKLMYTTITRCIQRLFFAWMLRCWRKKYLSSNCFWRQEKFVALVLPWSVANTDRLDWPGPKLRHLLCRSLVGDTRDAQEPSREEQSASNFGGDESITGGS